MISIIIPVYFEDKNILKVLTELEKKVKTEHEILIVYDVDEDPTVKVVSKVYKVHKVVKLIKSFVGNGHGVVNAFKSGLKKARGKAVVVVMADLSDDLEKIDLMFEKIKSGYDIICGSRYMKGGQQIGGPRIKGFLSRMAGLTLHYLFRLPTHDPTNAFKMYKTETIKKIKIESDGGFEYNLELIVKAHKKKFKIAEIPAIWKDRTRGKSKFNLVKWLPKYIRWYLYFLTD